VGRLDRDSEGLLILTNDGELAYRLTHPRFHLEKEYEVAVAGGPGAVAIETLRGGIELDGKKTQSADIRLLEARSQQRTFSVVLKEGRKRQIRRMFEEIGARVVSLKRVRVGPVKMGHLPAGAIREIKGAELQALRQAVGLEQDGD
jgi:pseudouridine synthase